MSLARKGATPMKRLLCAGLLTLFAVAEVRAETAPSPASSPMENTLANVTFSELLGGVEPLDIAYGAQEGGLPRMRCFKPRPAAVREPARGAPVVVWIHGGAWVGGTLEAFMPAARYTAWRGAFSVNLEYRLARPGVPGGATIADCVRDCREAVRVLRSRAAELGIDPKRIALVGDSAGGHLAVACALLPEAGVPSVDDPARPDALVLLNPVLDLTEGDWVRYVVGGEAFTNRRSPVPRDAVSLERACALSPGLQPLETLPPTLVLHGLADVIVPPAQAERFAAAAARAGRPVELELRAGQPHAFALPLYKSKEPVVVEAFQRIDRFLGERGWFEGEPALVPSPSPAWVK